MNVERLITATLTTLNLDKLKAEDALEQIMKEDKSLNDAVSSMKIQLKNIVEIESSIAKFTAMLSQNNGEQNAEAEAPTE